MQIERTFLFSKLARRIFWLFVLCALLPVAIVSALSLVEVNAQLQDQSRQLLRQTSREAAMNIFEHLTILESDMRLIGSTLKEGSSPSPSLAPSAAFPKLQDRLKGLEVVTDKGPGEVLFGKVDVPMTYSAEEEAFLSSGKTLLATRDCGSPAPCMLLSQRFSPQNSRLGTLVAQVQPSYLWDADSLPLLTKLCVLDDAGRTLFCPDADPSQLPPRVATTFSGQFNWTTSGQEYLSDYWSVPLKPRFFTSHWTVIASKAKSDVLAPLDRFKKTFLLSVLLAFWIVLLLSLIQIRRNMIPLRRLHEGTQRITNGDFATQVTVPGDDEFAELASSFNFMTARIQKQLSSLKTVTEIDRAILSSWNIEQVVDALMVQLHQLIPYESVSLTLLQSGSDFQAQAHVSSGESASGKRVQSILLSQEEVASLVRSPEISTEQLSRSFPSYLEPLHQLGMNSFLIAPILLDGKLSAIIALGHTAGFLWSGEDKQQVAQLIDQVAVAISNARLVAELKQLHWGTLTALARAIDAKSPWTSGHSERVTGWALKIARFMGLPEREIDVIHRGGLLHDIGKIGTPMWILDKPGRLTDEEMQQMREHVRIGARIMEPIPGFKECLPIILQHHEWVNGSGYPDGLKGDEISLHARIFAVADCYDALTSDRPYRAGMSPEKGLEIITSGAGKQFDPVVVAAFLNLLHEDGSRPLAEPELPAAPPVAVS